APAAGIEPAPPRLTAERNTFLLRWNDRLSREPAAGVEPASVRLQGGCLPRSATPARSSSSPRRELNSSRRFTKPMHDRRATRASMSSSIRVTASELRDASAWAEEHVRTVHAGDLPNADLRIFHIPAAGIGGRTVVLCEACDRVRVSDANHRDVTDYSCW